MNIRKIVATLAGSAALSVGSLWAAADTASAAEHTCMTFITTPCQVTSLSATVTPPMQFRSARATIAWTQAPRTTWNPGGGVTWEYVTILVRTVSSTGQVTEAYWGGAALTGEILWFLPKKGTMTVIATPHGEQYCGVLDINAGCREGAFVGVPTSVTTSW